METEECAICLELLENDIAILTCKHKFHFNCITTWMSCKNNYTNFCTYCDMDNEITNVINVKNEPNTNKSTKIVNSHPLPPLPPLQPRPRQLPPLQPRPRRLPINRSNQHPQEPEKRCIIS